MQDWWRLLRRAAQVRKLMREREFQVEASHSGGNLGLCGADRLWLRVLYAKYKTLVFLRAPLPRRLFCGFPTPSVPAVDSLRMLRSAYEYMAQWTAKDNCLVTALAVTEWLRRYDARAMVRVGVTLFPFEAHAWCELTGLEDTQYYSRYMPLERHGDKLVGCGYGSTVIADLRTGWYYRIDSAA